MTWRPHGRSWKRIDSRAFEFCVLPCYSDHHNFYSFIRQANGWGLCRIRKGKYRNAYYQELFLRGMPFLCKKMKRPGIAKKITGDPDHEPDFYQINKMHPIWVSSSDDGAFLLPCTLLGRPEGRTPEHMSIEHDEPTPLLRESQQPQLTITKRAANQGIMTTPSSHSSSPSPSPLCFQALPMPC